MAKNALFVFRGDPACFIHVLLNALDMKQKGDEALIVLEGESTKLVPGLYQPENPLNTLWTKALNANLVAGVCRACAHKMGTLKDAEEKGLAILDDMNGHPSMSAYQAEGFAIITF